jgi:serpin B
MLVLLPTARQGLSGVGELLTRERLEAGWDSSSGRTSRSCCRDLRSRGAGTGGDAQGDGDEGCVRAGADFSGLNGKRDLFISKVIHQAFVDVNEEGDRGGGRYSCRHEKEPAAALRCDHPFLFLIRDRQTASILFLGRVVNPKS